MTPLLTAWAAMACEENCIHATTNSHAWSAARLCPTGLHPAEATEGAQAQQGPDLTPCSWLTISLCQARLARPHLGLAGCVALELSPTATTCALHPLN